MRATCRCDPAKPHQDACPQLALQAWAHQYLAYLRAVDPEGYQRWAGIGDAQNPPREG